MADHASTDQEQKSWGEGGTYRVLLHGLVGAATAELGGGDATQGALGAAASEAASGAMANYLADHHIDPNSAEGRTLMELASAAVGGAVGGGAGATTALDGERYNRQLHPSEQQLAQTLAAKSGGRFTVQEIEDAMRLSGYSLGPQSVMPGETAQTGSLVDVDESGTIYDTQASWLLVQGPNGSQYLAQQVPGQVSPELAAYITDNTGGADSPYAWAREQQGMAPGAVAVGELQDWVSDNQLGSRTLGGLQMVGGALEFTGGVFAAATCGTGFGCAASMYLTGAGLDNAMAGSSTLMNGPYTATLGEQGLQWMGLSPKAASLVYGISQMVPAGVEAYIANNAINAEAAANAWARGTYTGASKARYSGDVYRYSLPEYMDGTWDIYPGNIASDHRYSSPGVGAVYAGTSSKTAAAEVASYGALDGRVLVTQDVTINNVLDLTNPAARKALGVTADDLTNVSHGGDAYAVTQRLSAWARDQGYQAILAPSAQNSTGVNLISFQPLGKGR
jgi:filamentous hemagglutinin